MPKPKVETVCPCCKRSIHDSEPEGRCWECRGRPSVAGRPRKPPGERDPSCPHDWEVAPD